MDSEYPGRHLNREMAFRLAMMAWKLGTCTGNMGGKEVDWAIRHLANELRMIGRDEPLAEVVNFLERYRGKWNENKSYAIRDLSEREKLWDDYFASTRSSGIKLENWGNPEKRREERAKIWLKRLNPWK